MGYALTPTERMRLRWAVLEQIQQAKARRDENIKAGLTWETAASNAFIKEQQELLDRLYRARSVTIKED